MINVDKLKFSFLLFLLFLLLLLVFILSPKGLLKEDEENILDLLEKDDGRSLQDAKPSLLESREFILKAVRANGLSLRYAPPEFQNEREICLTAVEENGYAIQFVGDEFRNDKEMFLVAAKQEICYPAYFLVSQAGSELLNDKELILEVLKGDPKSLKMLSIELQNDFDVVMQAVTIDGSVMEDIINEEFQRNEEIVTKAVQSDGCSLQFVKESFRENKEIVIEAINKSPPSLEFASDDLKNDKEIVLRFFENLGIYVFQQYTDMSDVFPNGLGEELRNDEDIALTIIFSSLWRESLGRINLISEDLLHEENFVWKILNYRNGSEYREFSILEIIPEEFRGRMDIVDAAIELDRETFADNTLAFASEEIRNNKEYILDRDSQFYFETSGELKNDRDFVLQCVREWGPSLRHASEELQCDREIVIEAVRSSGSALRYVCEELRNEREIVLEAVRAKDGNIGLSALGECSEKFRDDKEIVLEAVKHDGTSLRYASERLKDDKEVVLAALGSENGGIYVLSLASERLQNDKDIVYKAVEESGSFKVRFDVYEISSKFRNDENLVMNVLRGQKVESACWGIISIGKRREFYRGSKCSDPQRCSTGAVYFDFRDYEREEAMEIFTWWRRFKFLGQVGGRLRRKQSFLKKVLTSFGVSKYLGLCDLIYDERFERRRNKLFGVLGKRFFEIVQNQFGCPLDYKKEEGKGDYSGGEALLCDW